MTWLIIIAAVALAGLLLREVPSEIQAHEQMRRAAKGDVPRERFAVLTTYGVENAEELMEHLWHSVAPLLRPAGKGDLLLGAGVLELHMLAECISPRLNTQVQFIVRCAPEMTTEVKTRIQNAFPDQVVFLPLNEDPIAALDAACFPGPTTDRWPARLRLVRRLLTGL